MHGRNAERADAVASAIRADGGRAGSAVGDLTTDDGAAAVVAAAGEPVDVLVNNAGGYDHLSWSEATPAAWAHTYELNVISYVRMIRAFVPGMRARGWGRVIGIGGNRYFGSKEKLFAEVVDTSLAPPTVVTGDAVDLAGNLGHALAARTATDAERLGPFLLMLRSAADPSAAKILREGIEKHVGARFARLLDGRDAEARAQVGLSLVAGIWLMRTVLATTALKDLDDQRLGDLLAGMFASVVRDPAT